MELKVTEKNKKYADILKKEIEGEDGELQIFYLFKYQSLNKYLIDTNIYNNLEKLSTEALNHYEELGKILQLLGGNIELKNIIFDDYLNENNIEKIFEIDIRKLKQRIISYTNSFSKIEDKYIKEVLQKYIIDYRNSLKILEMLQLKYKKTKQI